jgi:lysophospholipase L1-like esterase
MEAVQPVQSGGVDWYDVKQWGVEGKGWNDTERYFDRLPARAKGKVRPEVWNLSRDSAGMLARFETDSREIHVRWQLRSEALAMPHFAATGVSGVDLYARTPEGKWRWVATGQPDKYPVVEKQIISNLDPGCRAYMLYLPLYNGVEDIEIGVAAGAAFQPLPPRRQKPILFYGTSIVQGACASRPGMCHVAILGRRLNQPVINLGFSGNALMEPEVADLIAELDPSVFVIDCLPNMYASLIEERAEPLLRKVRAAHPETPIVLVEDRSFTNAYFLAEKREYHAASRAAFRAVYEKLLADGVKGLYYIEGEGLLGDDGEASVDGSHPTDVGFMRMADILEPVLRPLVEA